jgi:membrane protein YdbS with pleckstrin-like domain
MITLEKDEHIILEVRKHWFFWLSEISLSIVFALFPIFLFIILGFSGLVINMAVIFLFLFSYSLWFLAIWVVVFVFWTNQYLDLWIVTDHKIFAVEQHGLFKREVSIIHYENIQDITYDINGLISSMFKFGNLYVQTAGTETQFEIKGIKDPSLVQKKLNEILLKKNIANN